MNATAWLVWVGIAAVVLAFIAVGVLPHPYGSILGGVLSGAGILAVARAESIHKRGNGGPHS